MGLKPEERAEEARMDRDKLGIYGPYIKYITDTEEVAEDAQFYERNGQSRPMGPAMIESLTIGARWC